MNEEPSGSHKNIQKDQEDQKEDQATCAAVCLSVGPLGEHVPEDLSKFQYTSLLSPNVLPPSGLTMLGIVCISKVWEPFSPRKNYSLQDHPSWTHWPHSAIIYRTSGPLTRKPYIGDTDNYFFTFAFKEQGMPIKCDGCPFHSRSRPILVPLTILLPMMTWQMSTQEHVLQNYQPGTKLSSEDTKITNIVFGPIV